MYIDVNYFADIDEYVNILLSGLCKLKGIFAMCVLSAAELGIQGQRLRLVHNQLGTIFCDLHCHWSGSPWTERSW